MAQLSSTDVFGDIRVRGNVRSENEIYEEGKTLVSKYATKSEVNNISLTPGPRGATGATGPRGPQGIQGPKGDTGARGPTGATGAASTVAGPRGATGATGPQGPKGDKGDTGARGPTGATGAASTVAGPRGATGPKGDTGARGPQGPKGDTGARGPTGAASTVAGPKGDKGDRGATGPRGATGATGATGPRGPQGATGARGPAGSTSYTANAVNMPDTRSVADAPSSIPRGTLTGAFKTNATVNNPPVSTGSGYSHILNVNGFVGGNSGGGGHTTQIAVGNRLAVRQSTSTSAWGGWRALALKSEVDNISLTPGPRGATGARGPTGPQGPQGPKGNIGATGARGATGPRGATGSDANVNYTNVRNALSHSIVNIGKGTTIQSGVTKGISIGEGSNIHENESISIGSATNNYGVKGIVIGGGGGYTDGVAPINIGLTNQTGADYTIAIGNHTESQGYRAIALGKSAISIGSDSVSIGSSSLARDGASMALGSYSKVMNWGRGTLGAEDPGEGPYYWTVPGNLTVQGTKNFEMPHPKPEKSATHRIRHSAVESPTAGDNLYRYKINAVKDNDTQYIDLPDYFIHLNKDVQIFVTGQGHFGNGYGKLNRKTEKIELTLETKGSYNILAIGTRNDEHQSVKDWNIKGVEKKIGESWIGETYVFEVDEIIEIEEIKEENNDNY